MARKSAGEDASSEVVVIHKNETAAAPAEAEIALRSSMPTDAAGTFALAMMDEDEFVERLDFMKRGRDRTARIQRELMEVDVDYGLIPGTPKPTLFKPGAEKLALVTGLAANITQTFSPGDGDKTPPLMYSAECALHLGSFSGIVVAVGHGTANSWEKRYRREGAKTCPNCGKPAIIKSKAEYGGGWLCFKKKEGCSSKFRDDDERITQQATDSKGDAVDAWDMTNTLLKMAEKRAFVDAVLRATASSGLFTQDMVEEPSSPSIDTTSGGRVVDTSTGEAMDEPPPEPEMRSAEIEGIQRGGHRDEVTDAQIASVRQYSKTLWGAQPGAGPYRLADVIADTLGGGIDSTSIDADDPKAAGAEVMAFLKALDPDDMGKLLQHLRKVSEAKP